MTFHRNESTGFAPPRCERRRGRRSTAFAQLVTSAALVLSIGVAATAVSMGIARADGLVTAAKDSSAAIASVLAMIVIAAGLTIAVKRSSARVKTDE